MAEEKVGCFEEEFPLHYCVFLNDKKRLSQYLRQNRNLGLRDKHGNTALHLAVMLGRKECIHLLLAHGAPVKAKNAGGWSPLAEAISYGDRQIITLLLRKLKQQARQQVDMGRANVIKGLKQMKDFYMELKWDFHSWVPLVSRMLPSDICKIRKSGASIRLDTTLVDFNDMRWERGDISFLFRGDKPSNEAITVLDNEYECYQRIRCEEIDTDDEVDMLMSTDIISSQMSTKNVQFARVQSGWIFRGDRKELVGGQYHCDLYNINGLVFKSRKRREHLSPEDLQKNKAMVESITKGRRTSVDANGDILRRNSLLPPKISVTWMDYITADPGKHPKISRDIVFKQSSRSLRATVAMSKDFPLSVEMLLSVLEVIAPFKHLCKLREFIRLKLPSGFPVKIEIPLLTTVTAKITFQKFEFCDSIAEELFEIPKHYVEDRRRFPEL